jgi:hypothetical protein
MVVAVVVGLMVVLVEDWPASTSPEPGSRPPRHHQLSSSASEGGPNQGADPQRKIRRHDAVGAASLPLTSRKHLGRKDCTWHPCPCQKG